MTLDIRLQDIRVSGVALGKRGKQGCSSAPLLWNTVLDHVFGLRSRRQLLAHRGQFDFLQSGIPLPLGRRSWGRGDPLTGSLWADDNTTFAHSVLDAARMTQDLSYALGDNSLGWKPGSLCLLANRAALQQAQADLTDGFLSWTVRGLPSASLVS